jgi:hypothetical protein
MISLRVQLLKWLKDPAHRVDRVKGFFSSRPTWDTPPPFGSAGGGDTLACGRGGGGVPIRTEGQTFWNSRYIYVRVLCDPAYMFFRSGSGQNMTAESDCHASGPPKSLKMDLLKAMEDFVRAWLRSESTLLCKKRLAVFLSPAGM